jgi:opacity protein-like surface antigen
MNRSFAAVLGAALVCAAPATARAQQDWSLEFRGGVAFPTQDLGDADLDTGLGLEGSLARRVMPHLWAYAGWDWFHFDGGQVLAGPGLDVEETGYAFGLRFEHPVARSRVAVLVRAGGTYDHIELENDAGDSFGDSGHDLGWEVGGGIVVPIGDAWRLTPGIRYRSLSTSVDVLEVPVDLDLSYVAVDVGVAWRF